MIVLKPDEEFRELESLSIAINIKFCIGEKVLILDIKQQNDKSTQEYNVRLECKGINIKGKHFIFWIYWGFFIKLAEFGCMILLNYVFVI